MPKTIEQVRQFIDDCYWDNSNAISNENTTEQNGSLGYTCTVLESILDYIDSEASDENNN